MVPGPMEIAILLLVAIVLFGHKRLGELGSSMGKALGNFRAGFQQTDNYVERLAEKNNLVATTKQPSHGVKVEDSNTDADSK